MPRSVIRVPLASVLDGRKRMGRLSAKLVRPLTLHNYNVACQWFFKLLVSWNSGLGDDLYVVDDIVSEAIEYA